MSLPPPESSGSSKEAALLGLSAAARALRTASTERKNRVLEGLAERLRTRASEVLEANLHDLAALDSGEGASATAAFRDRLTLTPERLRGMERSLLQVAALPDPVGEVVEERGAPNGLAIRRVRAPLGVIFMIYESRPNVALEAFSLALKSGNALLLRGGKESVRTVSVFYRWISESLHEAGFQEGSFWGITDPSRELLKSLLARRDRIDVVVPRGGDRLIEFVVEHSRIPIIKNDRGLCHLYVHEDADLEMALSILKNGKTQRPGVCNALETLLVHESVARDFLLAAHAALPTVRWHAEPRALAVLQGRERVLPAGPGQFDREYLDLEMSVAGVASLEEALNHIALHGSRHSEAIVTRSASIARRFQSEVDAAAVYWNASTRFTDGFELGLGGELGISTQKLHVRGPVGLRELTSVRWIIDGEGQVRG